MEKKKTLGNSLFIGRRVELVDILKRPLTIEAPCASGSRPFVCFDMGGRGACGAVPIVSLPDAKPLGGPRACLDPVH